MRIDLTIDKDDLTKFAIENKIDPEELRPYHIKDKVMKYFKKSTTVVFVDDDGKKFNVKDWK